MTRDFKKEQIYEDSIDKKKTRKKSEKSPSEMETTVPPTVTNGEIINALYVKVRKEPSFESEVLGVLRNGDKVEILEKRNQFWKVSTGLYNAYISSEFIKEG